MVRLVPFLVCFGAGFFAGVMLALRGGRSRGAFSTDWEAKYREVEGRYRDLTRRLEDADRKASARATVYRTTLRDVAELMKEPEKLSAENVETTYQRIVSVLGDS